MDINKYIIYTDGSSKGNPGPGGWGAVIINGGHIKELGGREEKTTNNRMEMTAAIKALQIIPEKPLLINSDEMKIEMYTDSEYLMKGITIWIKSWQKNDWRTKDKKDVLNKDLWEELWTETSKRKIEWKKVLGHSGEEWNERCDEIATNFADGLTGTGLYDGPESAYKVFHHN